MVEDLIIEEKYFEEIKLYDKKYYEIISKFNLNFPKCLNLQKEKKIFFDEIKSNKIYNPQFEFEVKVFDEKYIEELKKLKINLKNDLYGFKKLYSERLKTKKFEIDCHKLWGLQISTNSVLKYRGKPDLFLLNRAKYICRKYQREKVKFNVLTPEEIGVELKKLVFNLTQEKIKVIFCELSSKVNINASEKIIKINPNERFTSLDLKRLKIHEIGTHYLRYFNGNKFIPQILASGSSNYIEIEEGLATFMEEKNGVLSKAQLFIYAGRVIATYYALKKSFYEVYMILKKYGFKDSDAFAITFRSKRNLNDTSKPGGFTKDYVYLSGYYKIKHFAKNHDVRDLFVGKIKITDLRIIRKFVEKNKNKIQVLSGEIN